MKKYGIGYQVDMADTAKEIDEDLFFELKKCFSVAGKNNSYYSGSYKKEITK